MARQDLNLGTNANDGTGDRLRLAMKKVNDNFIELYTRTGGDGTQNIEFNGNVLSCNGNLSITTNDTGSINLEDLTNINANLNVFTHLRVNTSEADANNNLLVNGNTKIKGTTTLGDDIGSDQIILNSTLTGPVTPSVDGLYDLGTPSLRFRNIYIGGTVQAGSVLFSNVNITGGTINNTIIGGSTPAEATFTRITVLQDSVLGNLQIRDNMIYAQNPNGNIELRTNGGNVFVPSNLLIGTGTNTGEKAQINGDAKVTGNIAVGGNASVTGDATVSGNVIATANITGTQLISTVDVGTAPFVVASTTLVPNLYVANAVYADSTGTTATVTSAAQPNITSLGTLTGLNVSGNVTLSGTVTIVDGKIVGDTAIIPFIIDGGGDVITTGSKKYLGPMAFGGTIYMGTILADQVGSIDVEVRKCAYNDFDAGVTHPSSGDIISATSPLTLVDGVKFETGWDQTFEQGDIFEFVVNSADAVTWVEITLAVTKG